VTAKADDDGCERADAPRADQANKKPFDRALVSKALNQLQPLPREVIRRAYYLGRTTDQIAADLNVAEPVVKSQLHSALHTVQHFLVDPTLRCG
jgi:RNA polymerase sigma factor (sigma-70 family)